MWAEGRKRLFFWIRLVFQSKYKEKMTFFLWSTISPYSLLKGPNEITATEMPEADPNLWVGEKSTTHKL
jgi:hypothetical protein